MFFNKSSLIGTSAKTLVVIPDSTVTPEQPIKHLLAVTLEIVLRAILNSGYINNLISDDKTLKEIIRMDKASTDS